MLHFNAGTSTLLNSFEMIFTFSLIYSQGEVSAYSEETLFECLECAEGCDSCEDASPCIAELNWPMRSTILILACAIIGFLPPAALFTFRYQQVKVGKSSSSSSFSFVVFPLSLRQQMMKILNFKRQTLYGFKCL